MKRSLECLVLIILCFTGRATAQLELNTPLAPDLRDVLIADNGQRAFCISNSGHFFTQEANGQWLPIDTRLPLNPTERPLFLVRVDAEADTFFVNTFESTTWLHRFFVTTDGGATFQIKDFGDGYYPYSLLVDPDDHSRLYAVNGSAFMRSVDGGDTWTSVGIVQSEDFHDVYRDPTDVSKLWITSTYSNYGGTESQGLLKSSDGGDTWQPVADLLSFTGATNLDCNGIFRATNGSLFAELMDSQDYETWFLVSDDEGDTWTRITEVAGQSTAHFYSLNILESIVNPGVILLAPYAQPMYRSVDYGETWVPAGTGLPGNSAIVIVQLAGTGQLVASVEGYGFYLSNDFGLNWSPRSTPRIGQKGELTSSHGTLFSNQDGRLFTLSGPNSQWQEIAQPVKQDTTITASKPFYLGDNTIAALYVQYPNNGSVWEFGIAFTQDLGNTWHYNPPVAADYISNVLWDESNEALTVYALGSYRDSIFISSDTGQTWISRALPDRADGSDLRVRNDVLFFSSQVLWYSFNGAETWIPIQAPTGSNDVHVIVPNGNDLYLSVGRPTSFADSLYIYKQGGEGWQQLYADSAGPDLYSPFRFTLGAYPLLFLDEPVPTLVAQVGTYKLVVSQDNGETWRDVFLTYPENYDRFFQVWNETLIALDGRIWLNTEIGPCYIGIDELALPAATLKPLPTEFSLTIFPNPFNETTRFQFSLPSSAQTTLTLYDVLGREVAKLFDEQLTAGTHTTLRNASSVSSGTYFAKLNSGGHEQTQKLILLK